MFHGKTSNAKIISVCSGKGGVGKTFTSIHLAKTMADSGKKTLLLDLDYNLANCAINLGQSINDDFVKYLQGLADWKTLIHKTGNLDFISTCNGNKEVFLGEYRLQTRIVDLLSEAQQNYDYIILDTGSGLIKEQCNLMSIADLRLIVFRPEASSMTDGYSLFKILLEFYGNKHFSFIINDYDNYEQVNRVKKVLTGVAEKFTQETLHFFGSVPHLDDKEERSSFEEFFLNISQNMVEYIERNSVSYHGIVGSKKMELPLKQVERDFDLGEI
ncbi:MAG: AAA family ATPase [Bacteriovoracaceae bacterium]|nr:AAA family ATPase [Bacteriovoracaceae bacterium]